MPAGSHYTGRFAPSPTGPLHLGSLIAALASFLDARHAGGRWLVRMEDLDPPREQPGAAQAIFHSLLTHGLAWDDEPLWQSTRAAAYDLALAQLADAGLTFTCDCTRARLGPNGCCNGHCQPRQGEVGTPFATRLAVSMSGSAGFEDGIQGRQQLEPPADFTLKRKDGLYAYQLAVVVDDSFQNISHIVRGSDIMDSTPRQLALQKALGLTTPHYSHVPVITDANGQKFSKQNHAPALDDGAAPDNLRAALHFLNQPAVPAAHTSPGAILAHAVRHWSLEQVPAAMAITATNPPGPG